MKIGRGFCMCILCLLISLYNTFSFGMPPKQSLPLKQSDIQVEDDDYAKYVRDRRDNEAEQTGEAEAIEKARIIKKEKEIAEKEKLIKKAKKIAEGAEEAEEEPIGEAVTSLNLKTPITQHKKSYEQKFQIPQQQIVLQPGQIYEKQQQVASKFLAVDGSKQYLLHKNIDGKSVDELFQDFTAAYDNNQPVTLNITGLSSRARISLLVLIINHKLKTLPENYRDSIDKDQIVNCEKWERTGKQLNEQKKQQGIKQIYDKIPTTFQIKNHNYKLTLGATKNQPAGGRLSGVVVSLDGWYNPNETYNEIFQIFDTKTQQERNDIAQALFDQKKSGNEIPMQCKGTIVVGKNKTPVKLTLDLNGFSLLLDYEVARRLVDGDLNKELPVIAYLNFIVHSLGGTLEEYQYVKTVFVGQEMSEWGFKVKFNNKVSLFTGSQKDDRPLVAQSIISARPIYFSQHEQLRNTMKFLHKDDEESGEEYSGDGKKEIREAREQQIRSFIEEHLCLSSTDIQVEQNTNVLDELVKQYIDGMSNSDPAQGEILWGGDVEIAAAAEIYDAEINIYQRGQQDPIVFNKGGKGKKINLWLENGHYRVYDPQTGDITNVDADGNCLFHAMFNSGKGIGGSHQSLRKGIAYYISKNKALRDYIRNQLFAPIVNAQNDGQLRDAIEALPRCSWLGKTISFSAYAESKRK